jgi:hypothetical protein
VAAEKTDASDLVMTQAELPPGIDAPSPLEERDRVAGGEAGSERTAPGAGAAGGVSPDLLGEIRRLADRVGGLDRLRAVVDELARMPR